MSIENPDHEQNEYIPRANRYEGELRGELDQLNGNGHLYLFELNARYEKSPLDAALDRVSKATLIDNTGNSLPANHPDVIGFRGGAVIAISIAERALPPNNWDQHLADVCSAESAVAAATFGELDESYKRRQAREAMIRRAYEGLGMSGVYSDVVMTIGRQVFPENIESFQFGFGFVLGTTARLLAGHEELSREATKYMDSDGKDPEDVWDQAISEFFDQQ